MDLVYPLAMSKMLTCVTTEVYSEQWLADNHVTISAIPDNSFGDKECHVVTMSIVNGGAIEPTYAATRVIVLGMI